MSDGPCARTRWREAIEDHPLEAPPAPGARARPSSPLVLYAVCMALLRVMDADTLVCQWGDTSTAAIARRAHVKPRAVRYALGDLERLGVLLVIRRPGEALELMAVMPPADLSTPPAHDAGEQTFGAARGAGVPRHHVPPSLVVTRAVASSPRGPYKGRPPAVDEPPRPQPPPAERVAAQRALWPAAVPDVGLPGVARARAALGARPKRGGLRIGARFGDGGAGHPEGMPAAGAVP